MLENGKLSMNKKKREENIKRNNRYSEKCDNVGKFGKILVVGCGVAFVSESMPLGVVPRNFARPFRPNLKT